MLSAVLLFFYPFQLKRNSTTKVDIFYGFSFRWTERLHFEYVVLNIKNAFLLYEKCLNMNFLAIEANSLLFEFHPSEF